MAELFIIGDLQGATGFSSGTLSCQWKMVTGQAFHVVHGYEEGQTQVDTPSDGFTCWSHPIDVHYGVEGLQGWPKLSVQVFHQDTFGRNELAGYGYVDVPSVPGEHELECVCWKPSGASFLDSLSSSLVGGGRQLRSDALVYTQDDRFKLKTVSVGKVHMRLSIIVRGFAAHGVEFS
eukprot:m.362831 g.362831  ORF g.362831 m.362831 type:complete len:177 (+) comp20978_c0_seq1:107-637(+)